MKLIIFLAVIMPIGLGACEKASLPNKNLTAITWAHAVNTAALLHDTLLSDVQMIEADIIIGNLTSSNDTNIPVMGHPPSTISDISLEQFMKTIFEYNQKNKNNTKGVKLDFKSTEVFTGSVQLLKKLWDLMSYPVWINADIISGPVNNTLTKPVDPDAFFNGCKQLPNATLSIGWTTKWGGPGLTVGNYTDDQVGKMIQAIDRNNIPSGHPITFPVRAGIAAQSHDNLQKLVAHVNQTRPVTITIWSSPNDSVVIDDLRKLILSFGLNRTYVDVPKELSNQLNLGSVSGASSLVQFGIINIAIAVLCFYLNN